MMRKGESKINPHTKIFDVGVNCPIFQKQEPIVKELTDNINKAKGVQEKARVSEELKKEIGVLLSCSDYDEKRLDCSSCHFIENFRKRTVDLIIKAKKLVRTKT